MAVPNAMLPRFSLGFSSRRMMIAPNNAAKAARPTMLSTDTPSCLLAPANAQTITATPTAGQAYSPTRLYLRHAAANTAADRSRGLRRKGPLQDGLRPGPDGPGKLAGLWGASDGED